ncbi:hypothetical protein GOODEAATRI_005203 [Goodea atripinnis]|uniref:Uncharacterized protein n=1 Tax=Goodea atripinnis TaxID=208336 RepID=A0ABV0P1L5_9TELE
MPPRTGGKDPCNVSGQQAEVRPRRRVAAVSTPALSASRLTLPGVMDAEGRILFERVTFDLEELREAIRIIDKDVPRTNRDLSYYQ